MSHAPKPEPAPPGSSTPASPPQTVPPSVQAAPAWSAAELSANPHARSDKPARVREMFAAIAGSYDLNNRVHSFGRDQAWRRFAVRAANLKPTDRVLDMACGTGDLTRAFAAAGAASVLGMDFTQEMLDVAERKRIEQAQRRPGPLSDHIIYRQGDAMAISEPDSSFDVLSIAFGIRNVLNPRTSANEFFRVLKPGGRLVILEFDKPRFAPIRWASDFYTRQIMPLTATWISGDRSGAYKYLPRSVDTFLDRDQLAQMLRDTGFVEIEQHPLSFGVCVCTTCRRPG